MSDRIRGARVHISLDIDTHVIARFLGWLPMLPLHDVGFDHVEGQ